MYSIHTNADFVEGGLNDFIFEKLGLDGKVKIDNFRFETIAREGVFLSNDEIYYGMTRIKTLENEITLSQLIDTIKEKLKLDFVRYVGDKNAKIKKIGLVTGAGSSLINDVKHKIDVFLTGDLKHHESLDLLEEGINLVDIGHYESEYLFVELLEQEITQYFDGNIEKFYGENVFQLG